MQCPCIAPQGNRRRRCTARVYNPPPFRHRSVLFHNNNYCNWNNNNNNNTENNNNVIRVAPRYRVKAEEIDAFNEFLKNQKPRLTEERTKQTTSSNLRKPFLRLYLAATHTVSY